MSQDACSSTFISSSTVGADKKNDTLSSEYTKVIGGSGSVVIEQGSFLDMARKLSFDRIKLLNVDTSTKKSQDVTAEVVFKKKEKINGKTEYTEEARFMPVSFVYDESAKSYTCRTLGSGGAGTSTSGADSPDLENVCKTLFLDGGWVVDATTKKGHCITNFECELEKDQLSRSKSGGLTTKCAENKFIIGTHLVSGKTREECTKAGGIVDVVEFGLTDEPQAAVGCRMRSPDGKTCPSGWSIYTREALIPSMPVLSWLPNWSKQIMYASIKNESCTLTIGDFQRNLCGSKNSTPVINLKFSRAYGQILADVGVIDYFVRHNPYTKMACSGGYDVCEVRENDNFQHMFGIVAMYEGNYARCEIGHGFCGGCGELMTGSAAGHKTSDRGIDVEGAVHFDTDGPKTTSTNEFGYYYPIRSCPIKYEDILCM